MMRMIIDTKNHLKWLIALIVVFSICGCWLNYERFEYDKARLSEKSENFKAAIKHYNRVIKRNPESELALKAAEKAGQLALLQSENYKEAIKYYKHIVVYSTDPKKRISAQKKIADIYFEKLTDYKKAIKEYSKLLQLSPSKKEEFHYRFSLAKAYFYLNNFYQANTEIKTILDKLDLNKNDKFQVQLFKANVHLTNKQLKEALKIFKSLKTEYPDLAKEEKVDMSIAVCYEEMEKFDKAINVLTEFKKNYPRPEFIDLKIKRLKQRKSNLPGAKGLRK